MKFFNGAKGYGFVTPSDGDVRAHHARRPVPLDSEGEVEYAVAESSGERSAQTRAVKTKKEQEAALRDVGAHLANARERQGAVSLYNHAASMPAPLADGSICSLPQRSASPSGASGGQGRGEPRPRRRGRRDRAAAASTP